MFAPTQIVNYYFLSFFCDRYDPGNLKVAPTTLLFNPYSFLKYLHGAHPCKIVHPPMHIEIVPFPLRGNPRSFFGVLSVLLPQAPAPQLGNGPFSERVEFFNTLLVFPVIDKTDKCVCFLTVSSVTNLKFCM